MSTPVDVRTYTVQVFRDHGFLILEVPELDATGQARSLTTAEATARELIAMWLDVPADHVQVVMDYTRIDPDALEMAAAARSEQARADEMTRAAAKQWREAARRLVRTNGLSLRDAAVVLGVTFSRVQQLLKD